MERSKALLVLDPELQKDGDISDFLRVLSRLTAKGHLRTVLHEFLLGKLTMTSEGLGQKALTVALAIVLEGFSNVVLIV